MLQDHVTAALSAAALDELALAGYARLSMEAVARRAGVGKAALYRRWKTKQELVVTVLGELLNRHLPSLPDTGSLEGDVREFMVRTLAELSEDRTKRIVLDMAAEMARAPALANKLWPAAAAPRRTAAEAMLRRAHERGELPADIDHAQAIDLLIAPLLFRIATRGDVTLGRQELDKLVHATVAGITAS